MAILKSAHISTSLMVTLTISLCVTSCSQRYNIVHDSPPWMPSLDVIQQAEAVAQRHTLKVIVPRMNTHLSEDEKADLASVPANTVWGIPFQTYRVQVATWTENGRKYVDFDFLHPKYFPNWRDAPAAFGGFPVYFSLTVDLDSQQVVKEYAETE